MLITDRVGYRRVAKKFSPLTSMELAAHKSHIAAFATKKAIRKHANTEPKSIAEQLAHITTTMSALAEAATESGNLQAGIAALRELRECLSMLHELGFQMRPVQIRVVYETTPAQEAFDDWLSSLSFEESWQLAALSVEQLQLFFNAKRRELHAGLKATVDAGESKPN